MSKVPSPSELPDPPEPQQNGQASHLMVCAFYLLIRDHVPAGTMEKVLAQVQGFGKHAALRGQLADYAATIADTLQEEGPRGD